MSEIEGFDSNEPKDQFTGFYVTKKGKERLDFMAEFFYERGMIKEKTFSAAARQCLDIGWTLVSEVIEAEADGQIVDKVTFTIPKVTLKKPI